MRKSGEIAGALGKFRAAGSVHELTIVSMSMYASYRDLKWNNTFVYFERDFLCNGE